MILKPFEEFWKAQHKWSIKTFGPISVRGPLGPLDHLQKELVKELLGPDGKGVPNGIDDIYEYVDCQFLLGDAVQRAEFTYEEYLIALWRKLEINKNRTWPDWRKVTDHTKAMEHDRSKD